MFNMTLFISQTKDIFNDGLPKSTAYFLNIPKKKMPGGETASFAPILMKQ